MKILGSLLLLFYRTAVTVSQSCTEEGAVEIIGTVTPTLIAGRLEICVGGFWRVVYDESYGFNEARLVCQERGFNNTGICRQSCFGASNLTRGFTDFLSCSRATQLIDCGSISPDGTFPDINAGIICFKGDTLNFAPLDNSPPNSTSRPTLPTPDFIIDETSESVTLPTGNATDAKSSLTLPTTSIALAAVSAILLLALVGVAMGWACSCLRRRNQDGLLKTVHVISTMKDTPLSSPHVPWNSTTSTSSDSSVNMQINPSYNKIVSNTESEEYYVQC